MSNRGSMRPSSGLVQVVGTEAARALWQHRPEDIASVLVIDRVASAYEDLRKHCVRSRIPFEIIDLAALTRQTETQRHDGICIMARRKRPQTLRALLARVDSQRGPLAVVLADRLRNPNNVGAVLRVAGYFGVPTVVLAGEDARLSMASMRTAQGAAELVDIAPVDNAVEAASALKSHGLSIVATSSHAPKRLGNGLLPKRALFLVGSENEGLTPELEEMADLTIAIPGAGAVESLNVANAAAIVLWEHWRSWRKDEAVPAPPSTAPSRRGQS